MSSSSPSSPQLSPLCKLPHELLERIAFHLVLPSDSFSALLPLQLSCKLIHAALAPSTIHILAHLFRSRFNTSSVLRRLGPQACSAAGFASQLVRYTRALRVIARGDIYASDVHDALWVALSMLLEDDGKNRPHLEHVGLPRFVNQFVRKRLYENSVLGWPAENEINSLALWLLWLTTTQEMLCAESPVQRVHLIRLILPFVLMPIRYRSALAPSLHFTLPLPRRLSQAPHSFSTAHGPYPHYFPGTLSSSHPFYRLSSLELTVPLASIAAKLLYFSRREFYAVPSNLPRTRAHAVQLGLTTGPTQEDVLELSAHPVARLVEPASADWATTVQGYAEMRTQERAKRAPSAVWDDDWNRMMDCGDLLQPVSLKRTHYTLGLLVGLWQGKMLRPEYTLYSQVIATAQMWAEFSEQELFTLAEPVFMRLREYHCMDVAPNEPAPLGSSSLELDDGIHNAWFPNGTGYSECGDVLTVTTPTRTSHYRAYVPGAQPLHDDITCRGCQFRGTSSMVFREEDAHMLDLLDDVLAGEPGGRMEDSEGSEDGMSDGGEGTYGDADMDVGVGAHGDLDADTDELVVERKCDGVLDIVLVGETDTRHGQAWRHYRFYGRVREWDGLVALVRAPVSRSAGVWIFTGYVVGGQTLVGNWRIASHPGEPVPFEGAFAMSKRQG